MTLPGLECSPGTFFLNDHGYGSKFADLSGFTPAALLLTRVMSLLSGQHSLKFGGEYRQFLNNNFRVGTGTFNFPTVADFLADAANSFCREMATRRSR